MLKLRLIQPGKRDEIFAFPGNRAVVGRKREGGVDIVVPQPFITGRHAVILKGLVVCDLGSTNGTFIAGQRIQEHQPVLVADGTFTLGRDEVRFVVESDVEDEALIGEATMPARGFQPAANSPAPELPAMRQELERVREEKARLSNEIEALRRGAAASATEVLQSLDAALRENADLKQRVASLRGGVEAREVEASASLQARLAQERMIEVQKLNVELEARVKSLESRRPDVHVVAGEDAISVRLLELQALVAEHERAQQVLRQELESARSAAASGKPAAPASELFFRLQRENQELREKVARFEASGPAGAAGGAMPTSNLFFQMQAENRDLRRRVAELEAQAPNSASKPATPAGNSVREIAALEGEVQRLRAELSRGARAAPAAPAPAPAPAPVPVPAGFPASPRSNTERLLRQLSDDDVEGKAALLTGRVDDFLTLEAFRVVRQVEKLVTRIAGEFLQMFDPNTQLPGLAGNLRTLTRAALESPEDPKPREALLRYLAELKGWLVAAVGAPRQAAVAYVREIRSDLSSASLLRNAPISSMKRLFANEAELWRRAEKRWNEITDSHVDERVGELTRAEALRMMNRPGPD